jgi:dephospho-CoA kinase
MTSSLYLKNQAFKLGLTGGIASGKTTVGRFLERYGASIVDADAIAHELTAKDGLALEPISRAFGKAFIDPDLGLKRKELREYIFQEPEAKKKLESILHPFIRRVINTRAQQLKTGLIVFDIPLLAETMNAYRQLDAVLVIDCDTNTQLKRVIHRSQIPFVQAQQILRQQASRQERLAIADYVICNHGIDIKTLERIVKDFYIGLKEMINKSHVGKND